MRFRELGHMQLGARESASGAKALPLLRVIGTVKTVP